jgi:hypothetical protein
MADNKFQKMKINHFFSILDLSHILLKLRFRNLQNENTIILSVIRNISFVWSN